MDIENVTMVGVNAEKTTKVSTSSRVYKVHFILSPVPADEWSELFETAWQLTSDVSTARAYVAGRYLVLESALTEMDLHVPHLERAIDFTNDSYAKCAQSFEDAAGAETEAERVEKYFILNKIKERLDASQNTGY